MKLFEKCNFIKNGIVAFWALVIILCCYGFNEKNVLAAETDIVNIPDANFKANLNEMLSVEDTSADITEAQMATIKSIYILSDDKVSDITGIEYCTNLETLVLYSSSSIDLSEIKSLSKLKFLLLYVKSIEDMTDITSCTKLETLCLSCYDMETKLDLSTIGKLENLQSLLIWDIPSNDYSYIGKLKNLKSLSMGYITCGDYSYIKDLTSLTTLQLNVTDIVVLPDLTGCKNLDMLIINNSKSLSDISSLKGVTSLTHIDLSDSNYYLDISPIKGMTNLTYLNIEKVKITEDNAQKFMSTIASLVNLETLNLTYSGIGDEHTSMFDNLTKIKTLYLMCCNISDLEFLLKHKDTLEKITLSSNEIYNNNVLEQMTKLDTLCIGDNYITDFSFISKLPNLTDNSIRYEEWESYFPSKTTSKVDLKLPNTITEYTIKNDVKDENGNYVAPIESKKYTYNKETNEITLHLDKLSSPIDYVEYEFVMYTNKGHDLYVEHKKRINYTSYQPLKINSQPQNIVAYKDDVASLSIEAIGSGTIEYQWYKDGKVIEGATNSTLSWEKIQLSDAGKYKVVIKDENSTLTSSEVTVTVYDKLKGTLAIGGVTKNLTAQIGETIKLNTTATGGSGGYTYKVAMLNVDTGVSTTLSDYSSSSTYTGELKTPGKKKFVVTVKDSNGRTVKANEITITVYEKLKGSLAIGGVINSSTAQVGETIKLKTTATGGSGNYTYKITMLNVDTGVWATLSNYSSSSAYTGELKTPGKKKFVVTVKDSDGRTVETNEIAITVYEKLEGTLAIGKVTKNLTAQVGEAIKLNTTATGGSGGYTYKVAMLNVDTGVSTTLSNYSSSSTYTGELKTSGKKKFVVTVKDSIGRTVKTNEITITVYEKLKGSLVIEGVTNNSTVQVGENIKLKTTATGGSGSYTYKVDMLNVDTGVWTTLSNYSSSNTYTGELKAPGKKKFVVTVKDSDGRIVKTNEITITVYKKLTGNLTVNGSTGTMMKLQGSKITLAAQGSGGSGNYTYKYVIKNEATGATAVLKDYSSQTSYTGELTSVGTKKLIVYVKDSDGRVVATNTVTIVVVEKPIVSLTVNGSTETINAKVGYLVTLAATATGGGGSYTYKYVVVNETTKATVTLKDYSSAKTYSGPITSTGTKKFIVYVKDSNGTVVASNAVKVVVS